MVIKNSLGRGASFALFFLIAFVGNSTLWAQEKEKTVQESPTKKGRAQLWEENCARCHNLRSPSSYSDAKWDVIVTHMRIRAYLTEEDAKAIVEFLKAGN